jgi:hypothetical protein
VDFTIILDWKILEDGTWLCLVCDNAKPRQRRYILEHESRKGHKASLALRARSMQHRLPEMSFYPLASTSTTNPLNSDFHDSPFNLESNGLDHTMETGDNIDGYSIPSSSNIIDGFAALWESSMDAQLEDDPDDLQGDCHEAKYYSLLIIPATRRFLT